MLKELFPNAIAMPHDGSVQPHEYCALGALSRFIGYRTGRRQVLETVDLDTFPTPGRMYRYIKAICPYRGDLQDERNYLATIANLISDVQRANDQGDIVKAYELAEELLDVCGQTSNRGSNQDSGGSPESVDDHVRT